MVYFSDSYLLTKTHGCHYPLYEQYFESLRDEWM